MQGCMSYTTNQSMRNILHEIIIIGAASGATRWAILKISRVAVMMMAGEMIIQHRSPWSELESYHRCPMSICVTQQILLEPCTLSDTIVKSKPRLGGEGNCAWKATHCGMFCPSHGMFRPSPEQQQLETARRHTRWRQGRTWKRQ